MKYLRKVSGIIALAMVLGLLLSTPKPLKAEEEQKITVLVNGEPVQFTDAAPYFDPAGRTMLPLRAVTEALGCKIDWLKETKTVAIAQKAAYPGLKKWPYASTKIFVRPEKKEVHFKALFFDEEAKVDTRHEDALLMDVAVAVKDQRTYLPIRPLAELLGFKVGWEGKTVTVTIDKGGKPFGKSTLQTLDQKIKDMVIAEHGDSDYEEMAEDRPCKWENVNWTSAGCEAIPVMVEDVPVAATKVVDEYGEAVAVWAEQEYETVKEEEEDKEEKLEQEKAEKYEKELFELINKERLIAGLKELYWNDDLLGTVVKTSKVLEQNFTTSVSSPYISLRFSKEEMVMELVCVGPDAPDFAMKILLKNKDSKQVVLDDLLKDIVIRYNPSIHGWVIVCTTDIDPLDPNHENTTEETSEENNDEKGDSTTVDSSNFEEEVLRLVNEERAKHGLSSLNWDQELAEGAAIRAYELGEKFSHTRPNGKDCISVLGDDPLSVFTNLGENIAKGQPTPEVVVREWMNSPGHRKNILNEKFELIGIGYYAGHNGWVQLFGTR